MNGCIMLCVSSVSTKTYTTLETSVKNNNLLQLEIIEQFKKSGCNIIHLPHKPSQS